MACGRAQRVLDESIDPAEADRLRADVEAALDELAELEEQAVELSDLDADDLPEVELPVAEPTGADDELTVCDSSLRPADRAPAGAEGLRARRGRRAVIGDDRAAAV